MRLAAGRAVAVLLAAWVLVACGFGSPGRAATPRPGANPDARSAATLPRARDAAASARTWRRAHERAIVREFAELLALPNVANDSAGIERNAAAIQRMCQRRGLDTRVLRLPGAPPLLVADWAPRGARRTLAFYAHYDGQPTDTASWHGLPWTPRLRDAAGAEHAIEGDEPVDPEWRLFARSAGDDKAPIVAMLHAIDALRAAKRAPAFRLRLVFEGEEEAGSPHLAAYLERYPEWLRPQAWLVCDGPVHQSGRTLLGFGARGITGVDLTVYGPVKGLHDGHYGNWVPNPGVRLANLIAALRDDDGNIRIPGFLDDVVPPSPAERAALAEIPDVETALRAEFQIVPEGGGTRLDGRLMRPALNVRGIASGRVGERASNTIPTEARASLDLRLVPAETPASVRERFERHLVALGWTIVTAAPDSATRMAHERLVRLDWGPGYPPARTALDHPFALEVAALMRGTGHDPVRVPTLGGSVPLYLFQRADQAPTLVLPIANHDDNQHAPDENLRLANLWDGIEVFAALFAGLGD